METLVLSLVLALSIFISIALGAYTIFYCENKEKDIFVSLLFFVVIYKMGYFFEINAETSDGAFVATKVLYFGLCFAVIMFFIYVAEYCGIRINKILLAILVIIAITNVIVVWTTNSHKLFYLSYELDFTYPVRSLSKERGILNTASHIYVLGTTLATVGMLIFSYISKRVRKPPWLVPAGVLCCVVAHIHYFLGLSKLGINAVPLAMSVALVFFCICVFKEVTYTDELTGIPNRTSFLDLSMIQMNRDKKAGCESYIIIFDIDHFKKVNSKYGHPFGDKVLKALVLRVKSMLRKYDLFGRYGGEDFVLYITEINKKHVLELAERLRLALCGKDLNIDGITINVSASFGIAPVDYNSDNLDGSIKLAVEAMHMAKKAGRNQVSITSKTSSSSDDS